MREGVNKMLNEMKSAFGGNIKKFLVGSAAGALMLGAVAVSAFAAGGFDQYGYNYNARVFVGAADGVDKVLDGKVWGDPTYANDHLVMKWSKAWDDARFHGASWTPDAWVDNEWNGMLPNGSQVTEHVKIIWVGPQLENSPYWRLGGYAIWGEFETIMDQGNDSTGHYSYAHATPNGYGGN